MIDQERWRRTPRLAGYAVLAALGMTAGVSGQTVLSPRSPPTTNVTPTPVSAVELAVTITSADWIHKPSSSTMDEFLPRRVTMKVGHRAGEVVLKCKLHPDATVSDCTVVDETNPAVPFGVAALRASSLFRIRPRAANGTATDANWVLIPISFDVTVIRN